MLCVASECSDSRSTPLPEAIFDTPLQLTFINACIDQSVLNEQLISPAVTASDSLYRLLMVQPCHDQHGPNAIQQRLLAAVSEAASPASFVIAMIQVSYKVRDYPVLFAVQKCLGPPCIQLIVHVCIQLTQ